MYTVDPVKVDPHVDKEHKVNLPRQPEIGSKADVTPASSRNDMNLTDAAYNYQFDR
ncbi:hypothetical protein J6590_029531 [Homalodisca vitripennis]|nr:hypothetical protein J6590_029531 [Homalodisca vitripennis]